MEGAGCAEAFWLGFTPGDCANPLAHITKHARTSALARIIYGLPRLATSMLGFSGKLCTFPLAATIIPALCAESLLEVPGHVPASRVATMPSHVLPISNYTGRPRARTGATLCGAGVGARRAFRCFARTARNSPNRLRGWRK